MDTITVNGFGESTHYDGATVTWEEAMAMPGGQLAIVARVAEPQARHNHEAQWDEQTWREAVREALRAAGWDQPESDNAVTVWITWDPGRDNTEEELLVEYVPQERATIDEQSTIPSPSQSCQPLSTSGSGADPGAGPIRQEGRAVTSESDTNPTTPYDAAVRAAYEAVAAAPYDDPAVVAYDDAVVAADAAVAAAYDVAYRRTVEPVMAAYAGYDTAHAGYAAAYQAAVDTAYAAAQHERARQRERLDELLLVAARALPVVRGGG